MALVCHVIFQERVTKGSRNFMSRSLSWGVSHHPTKFGGHRRWKWKCASGNVMTLVCHVIPQGRVAKGSISLVALDTAVVEIQ